MLVECEEVRGAFDQYHRIVPVRSESTWWGIVGSFVPTFSASAAIWYPIGFPRTADEVAVMLFLLVATWWPCPEMSVYCRSFVQLDCRVSGTD